MSQTEHTPSARFRADPIDHIQPVAGWRLCAFTERDGCGFDYPVYVARSADRDVLLDVSRFRFTPSQERFAWLVGAGFPKRPTLGPWDDTDIEMRMAVPAMVGAL